MPSYALKLCLHQPASCVLAHAGQVGGLQCDVWSGTGMQGPDSAHTGLRAVATDSSAASSGAGAPCVWEGLLLLLGFWNTAVSTID